jgi:hypothetical protein
MYISTMLQQKLEDMNPVLPFRTLQTILFAQMVEKNAFESGSLGRIYMEGVIRIAAMTE